MNPKANPPHYPWQDEPFEWHEYAAIFPMMPQEDLEQLAADIEMNKQINPIQLYDGKILDGRNRYAAIELINERRHKEGKPLKALSYGTFSYDVDPEQDQRALAFVKSANLNRRELTLEDKLKIALKLQKAYADLAKAQEQWRKSKNDFCESQKSLAPIHADKQAAKEVGIGQQTLSRAKAIEDAAPDLLEDVFQGKTSVNAAYNQIKGKTATKKEPDPDPIDDDETEPDSHIVEISNEEIVLSFVSNLGFLSPAQVQCCLNEIYNSRKSDLMDFLANLRMIEPTLFNEELTNV